MAGMVMRHSPAMELEFTVPANTDAERSVLGALIIKEALIAPVLATGLRAKHFALSSHRTIFSAIVALNSTDAPVSTITVAERLGRELASCGGCAYLVDLPAGVVPEEKHVIYLVEVIRSKAKLRRLAAIGERLQQAAGEPGADPAQLAAKVKLELESM